MEFLPLAFVVGAMVGAFIAAHITRAYWLEQIKELERIMTFPTPAPPPLRACELCRHGNESRDIGVPVMMCTHKLTRYPSNRMQPCSEARRQGQRCGPDARLWDSRAEAIARLEAALKGHAPHAWTGTGPAPAWWYAADGVKVYRDCTRDCVKPCPYADCPSRGAS